MNITEENVVRHLLKRNEKAISFIILQYGGLLAAIIKRHVNYQHQDYEECLDDVLLAIWNHIHHFNPEKNAFKQWIAAIAKYKAIDYQRKQITLRHQQLSVSDLNNSILLAEHTTEMTPLDELLEKLSASERDIIEKYYLTGTPSSEIAQIYSAKESWVHNKLSRGRKKLKEMWMKENGV